MAHQSIRRTLLSDTTNPNNMKIIKEGNIPPADRPWWTKQIIVCGYCKAQYQLDKSDNPAHGGERHPEGKHWVQSFCPTCKKSVTTKRVVMRSGEAIHSYDT